MEWDEGGEGGGGKEGGRGGARGLGQIALEVPALSCQSVSTGTIRDWGVGMSIMIGLAGQLSTRGMGTRAGVGGWDGGKGR